MKQGNLRQKKGTQAGSKISINGIGSIFMVSLLLIASFSSVLMVIPGSMPDLLNNDPSNDDGQGRGGPGTSEGEYMTAAGVSGDGYIYGDDMYGPNGKYRFAYTVSGSSASLAGWDSNMAQPSGFIKIPSSVSDGSATYNVDSIEAFALQYCHSIITVSIHQGIKSIGAAAFAGCQSLISIDVDPGNSDFISEDGVLYNKSKTMLNTYPAGKQQAKFDIPSGVTTIDDFAFQMAKISSIDISTGILSIDKSAFASCNYLVSINIDPDNRNYVSVDGVLYNNSMTEIITYPAAKAGTSFEIPSSVTSIGNYAFSGCSGLTSVAIPSGVTYIGSGVFSYCNMLMSINVDPDNPNYVTVDGVLYNKSMTEIITYPMAKTGTSFEIRFP